MQGRQRGCTNRTHGRDEQTMRHAFPKARGFDVFIVIMERVVIAGQPGEEEKMGIGEGLGGNMKFLA